MKGTMVAGVAGLVALVAVGAAGGALLVERTLTEEATRSLAAQGLDAHVTFSGLPATVSAADPDQLPTAMKLVLDIPGVIRAEADRSSLPAASTSQATKPATPTPSPSPTPTPSPSEPTPSPSPSPSPTPKEMPKSVVKFEGGESEVSSSERTKIVELAVWLQANPDVTVEVAGHTDNGRSSDFRRELSEKRAQRVVDALVAAGANRDQLVAVGKADTEPAESNSTPEGQAANRRVTFVQRGER